MTHKDFMDLIRQGRFDEAQKMLNAEKDKAEFAPDTAAQNKDGSTTFTRRGKRVEQDAQGQWQLKKK